MCIYTVHVYKYITHSKYLKDALLNKAYLELVIQKS